MDKLEQLEREVEYWSNYTSKLSDLFEELQKERVRAVRILQQKRAELARLKQVRMAKARGVVAV